MMTFEMNDTNCAKALRAVDPHGGGECDAAAAFEHRGHVDNCAACRKELESRRMVRARLKDAVGSLAVPLGLETRIQAQLRVTQQRPGWYFRLSAIGVAAALCLAVGVAYHLGELRFTAGAQEAYVASVSDHVATFLRAGLQDHLHCAVFRKYARNAPPVEKLAEELGPRYAPLIPLLQKQVSGALRVEAAHICRVHNRRFVHVAARGSHQLLSLVITRKKDGESIEGLLPALSQAGVTLYQGGAQKYQIAAFEAGEFRVYLVSDMAQQQNLEMLAAMAPEIQAMLQKLGA